VNNLPKVVTCFSYFVFILCCSAFISIGERVLLSCVRFSFFPRKPRDWLGEILNVSEMTVYFVSSGT